jgi:hypothetical protein
MIDRILNLVIAGCLITSSVANAQQIVVKNKPGEGQWTISFSRRHAPDIYELHTGCKTLSAAQVEAQKLIAWSNSMEPNSSWRLAIIEIEGEDGQAPGHEGPQLPSWLELANDVRAELNETAPVLEEYMSEVAAAYERAKQAKEGLLKLQGEVSKSVFDRVNGTIQDYNRQLDTAQSSKMGASFARFPRMTPVGPEILQKAGAWRNAKQQQFALEDAKAKLDDEKSRLDLERERLIQEDRNLRSEEERIAQLELLVATENNGSVGGPFTLFTGQYSNTRGSKRGEYQNFLEARAAGEHHMSQNSSRQPNYRITDGNGTDLEYDGLFGTKRASDDVMRSTQPANGDDEVDRTELDRAKSQLAIRRQALHQQVTSYRAGLVQYNQRLEQYEQDNLAHKARADKLANHRYKPSGGPRTTPPRSLRK